VNTGLHVAGFIEKDELCFVSDSMSLKEQIAIDKKFRNLHLFYDEVSYAVAGQSAMGVTYSTKLYRYFDEIKYKLTIGENARNDVNIYYILVEILQELWKNKGILKRGLIPSFLLGTMNKGNGAHLHEFVEGKVREVSFGSIGSGKLNGNIFMDIDPCQNSDSSRDFVYVLGQQIFHKNQYESNIRHTNADVDHQMLEHYISTSKESDLHSGGEDIYFMTEGAGKSIESSLEISPDNNNINNNNALNISGLM
jgi:hypothetical protein